MNGKTLTNTNSFSNFCGRNNLPALFENEIGFVKTEGSKSYTPAGNLLSALVKHSFQRTVNMSISLVNVNAKEEWGLLVMREQELRYQNLLEMSAAEWETWARDFIKGSKHVRRSIRFVNRIAEMRDTYITHAMRMNHYTIRPVEAGQVDMNLLRDMVDEPWKYGDDIAQALELEEQLRQTPKAWRVHYMWVRKEHEERDAPASVIQTAYKQYKINQKNTARLRAHCLRMTAATKIQAAWRGFETRCEQRWTDCARCLCHCVSYWMIGGPDGVCEDCFREVSPYYDPVEIIGEFPDEFPPEERFPDYETVADTDTEDEEEDRSRRSRRTCDYCERKTAMAGCSYCATCYCDEKLYKHDEL